LYFFRAFRDAVAPMMAVDVLKRLVARIADAAVNLHGEVSGLADQPVRAVMISASMNASSSAR
jgi:hypothetical protein